MGGKKTSQAAARVKIMDKVDFTRAQAGEQRGRKRFKRY